MKLVSREFGSRRFLVDVKIGGVLVFGSCVGSSTVADMSPTVSQDSLHARQKNMHKTCWGTTVSPVKDRKTLNEHLKNSTL